MRQDSLPALDQLIGRNAAPEDCRERTLRTSRALVTPYGRHRLANKAPPKVMGIDLPFPIKNLGTADRFNDSKDDYLLLTQELQADIRDMEGGAIVQAALAAKVPVYSVKAISDVAGSGSTTEQYLVNRGKALENLKKVLPLILIRVSARNTRPEIKTSINACPGV